MTTDLKASRPVSCSCIGIVVSVFTGVNSLLHVCHYLCLFGEEKMIKYYTRSLKLLLKKLLPTPAEATRVAFSSLPSLSFLFLAGDNGGSMCVSVI
jgi:hypothetical protein